MVTASHPAINGERLVLSFHGVGKIPSFVGPEERRFWLSASRLSAALDAIGEISASSGVPIQITFDDGNESDALIAMPELLLRGMTAQFFVCAGRIGTAGYLDESQLKLLSLGGMVVGSHGWAHTDWRSADETTLDREVREARSRLSDVVESDVDTVAIPFGSYDRRVLRALRRNGVRTAFTSDRGRAGDGWLVPRETWVDGWDATRLREATCARHSAQQRVSRSLVRIMKRLR